MIPTELQLNLSRGVVLRAAANGSGGVDNTPKRNREDP